MIEGQARHPMVDVLRDADVDVREIAVPRRGYRHERAAIRDLCVELRPDIVHTHGYRVDVVDRPVAARLGIPTVTTVHGPSFVGGLKGAFYEWLQRRNYRRYDAVVAVSTALRDSTLADGIRADRLHLIRNAWSGLYSPHTRADARARLGIPEDAVVVGWVGRMIPVKAGDVFLEAIARLPQPRPIVAMIGHGAEEASLRAQAERLGIASTIRMYPDVTDAGRVFRAFDTYVLSSRSEGLPVVVLEAMASGTPIVATRVGGVPEALSADDAWIVPSEDPDAMAEAIRHSLTDRSEAEARAASANRHLAGEFGLEHFLDRYEEVYRAVLGRRGDA